MFVAEVTSRQRTPVFTVRVETRSVRGRKKGVRDDESSGKKQILFDTLGFSVDKEQWPTDQR